MNAPDEGPRAMHDRDAEVALLSACIHSKTARIEGRRHLTGADFYDPAHETLWDLMGSLDRAGRNVDPVTVMAGFNAADPRTGGLRQRLIEVTTGIGHPDLVAEYAAIVRAWATRRRLDVVGRGMVQRATDAGMNPHTLASDAIRQITQVRDSGAAADVTALTMRELMAVPDVAPEWVVPDLLERGDRLMLTGTEGAGKSALSRQVGIMAAAGLHPFTTGVMPPVRTAFIDCENKDRQVRRQVSPLLRWLHEHDADDPMDRVMWDFPGRIDVTRDRDLGAVHRLLDAFQPDVLVIGPIYKMVPRALNSDDDAAPFLVALDSIMDRGVTLIIEAHAGHTSEAAERGKGARALRPRGSSALLGWPEFGLGLRAYPRGIADLEPWRGSREERAWPHRLRRSAGNRWVETSPDDRGEFQEPITPQETGAPAAYADHEAPEPQGSLL